MLCILSLAVASVLHVVGDCRGAMSAGGPTSVSSLPDGQGTDTTQAAETCHSCSVASYFNAVTSGAVALAADEVPEGRLVQVFPVSLRIAGPPPKG